MPRMKVGRVNLEDEFLARVAPIRSESTTALPYLFVGSGISKRYLNLPDWRGLLDVFAKESGVRLNEVLSGVEGGLPEAASVIGNKFNTVWWNEPRYADQVARYEAEVAERGVALKVAISEWIGTRMSLVPGVPGVDDTALASELELLRKAVIDGVITTNYDGLMAEVFPQFPVYVGQEDLLFSDAQFIAETYAIHGDVSRPQSLVLNTADYARMTETSKYLVAKLLTIFAEHPVVFLGYSIGDPYVQRILADIALAVGQQNLRELGERLYFIEWDRDGSATPTIAPGDQATEYGVVPMTRVTTHDFSPIFAALGRLERPFPAAILRELRKHVYDLVTDPAGTKESVVAVPMDSGDAKGLRVVFGVGNYDDKSVSDFQLAGLRAMTRERLVPHLLERKDLIYSPDSWGSMGFR